ncbi:hypothetical protein F511_41325 [Dorcoceras hygrometricum]|uniref:Uncharacterized protein n=1 Tax=Dorcoceras hygrometricum TaxID=472368 RepID=A0A2Z7BL25_9LAMI|nr:hypothetical protein F511_41325 [Dorcoceras hygrometricum]
MMRRRHARRRRGRCDVDFRFDSEKLRTNQYNQDLGLIHSTNGNHLESPNEGSSIDHQNPKKQSQGYIVPVSMFMAILVKVVLGPSIKLHAKNVLTSKQNSQPVPPEVTKSLAATDPNMPNPKKRKHKGGGKKTQTKPVVTQVTTPAPQTIATQTVENIGKVAPTNFDSEEDSEPESCPLVQLRCRKKQVSESSDSEATNSMPLTPFLKRRRTQRQHQQSGWTGVTIATQPGPIQASTTDQRKFLMVTFHKEVEMITSTNIWSLTLGLSTAGEKIRKSLRIAEMALTMTQSHLFPLRPFPALELDSLAGYEKDTVQTTDEPQNEGDEHQAATDQRDLDSTNLQLVATNSSDSSTLQLLNNAAQSLNDLSTRVSSLDLSYARLRDDTVITKHQTAQLRDQLKSTADGLDIKIDVLERTLTQRMVDELAVVKSQLAAIVEGLKETSAAKKGESGPSSRPREGTSGGGPSSHGGRVRSDNPGDPSNIFRYTKWF